MYMREPVGESVPSTPGRLFKSGLAVTSVATLAFGFFPGLVTAAISAANVFAK
jgi:hypothetical protein